MAVGLDYIYLPARRSCHASAQLQGGPFFGNGESPSLRMPVPRVSLDAPRHQGFLVQSDRLVSFSMLEMRPPFLSVSAALTDASRHHQDGQFDRDGEDGLSGSQ